MTYTQWVRGALLTVCDQTDPAKLDAYIVKLQSTPVPYQPNPPNDKMCSTDTTQVSDASAHMLFFMYLLSSLTFMPTEMAQFCCEV
jgi:hypothetical protein